MSAFKKFPIIRRQFDYIEISLISRSNTYSVAYTYIKSDNDKKKITESCMIETGMVGFSYQECAGLINSLLQINFFSIPVMSMGTILDEDLNPIADINWNTIQKQAPENNTIVTVH